MSTMTRVALGALCAAFVAVAPVPAHAQTLVDTDPTGDVVMATSNEDDEEVLVTVPNRKRGDVSSTTLNHNDRRIAIRVEYVELKRAEHQVLSVDMVTNEDVGRHLTLLAHRNRWAGRTEFSGRHYREVDCAVRHSIDYESNVIEVGFPRACADDPRWVQFRVGAFVYAGEKFFGDDALLDRPLTLDDRRLAQSDRVYRMEGSS